MKGSVNLITIANSGFFSQRLKAISDKKKNKGTDTDCGAILPADVDAFHYAEEVKKSVM
jgi:hypothetical protein